MNKTRVELYKQYRDEINKMEDESTFTNKEKVTREYDSIVDKKTEISKDTTNLQFSFDELINASNVYGNDVKTRKNPLNKKLKKEKILKIILFIFLGLLATGIVIFGILYFRGVSQ